MERMRNLKYFEDIIDKNVRKAFLNVLDKKLQEKGSTKSNLNVLEIVFVVVYEEIRGFGIEDFTWENLCSLQKINLYNKIEGIIYRYDINKGVARRMIKNYQMEKAAEGLYEYGNIINEIYRYLSKENMINSKEYINYIAESGRINFSDFRQDSRLEVFQNKINTNYPVDTQYSNLVSVEYQDNPKVNNANINCNTDNTFLKSVIQEFYENLLILTGARRNEKLRSTRVIAYYLGEFDKKNKINSYEDFNIDLLRWLLENLSDYEELYNVKVLLDRVVEFYRIIIEMYDNKYGESLFEEKIEIAIKNKSVKRTIRDRYDILYHSTMEETPKSNKWCIIPNNYAKLNSNSGNLEFSYIDFNDVKEQYREEFKDYLWNSDGNIKDKLLRKKTIIDFLNELDRYKEKVIFLYGTSENFKMEEFLWNYRVQQELESETPGGLKTILKTIRKYLKYNSQKYNVTPFMMNILSLKGLGVSNGGRVITKNDDRVLYRGFKEYEKIYEYGRIFTNVYEIFRTTKLRIGEILNIEIDGIVEDKVSMKNYLLYNCKTKRYKREKMILSPEVYRIFIETLEITNKFRKNGVYDNYLFIHPYKVKAVNANKRIDFYTHFRKVLKNVENDLEYTDYYPYNIRHTYINDCLDKKVSDNLTEKELDNLTGNSHKVRRKYYYDRNNLEIMAEIMVGTTFYDVDINGEIRKEEDRVYKKIKGNLGGCKEDKCTFEIGECLRCNSFLTFVNRIPVFEVRANEINSKLLKCENELEKEELVLEKKLIGRYLFELYKVRG